MANVLKKRPTGLRVSLNQISLLTSQVDGYGTSPSTSWKWTIVWNGVYFSHFGMRLAWKNHTHQESGAHCLSSQTME